MWEHPNDGSGKAAKIGNDAEQRFETSLKKAKMQFTRHTQSGDTLYWEARIGHYDYTVGRLKVDVKAAKCMRRGDQPSYELLCVELHGSSRIENTGWLFGQADIIATETLGGWLMLNRQQLERWTLALELQDGSVHVREWQEEPLLYRIYRRPQEPHEAIMWVRLADLLPQVQHHVLPL